jgi:hypothetical protein
MPRITHLTLLALLALTPAARAQAQARTGQAREIEAVRVVYREVEAAITAGRYTRRDSTVSCPGDPPGMRVSWWLDSARRIRQLRWSGGSDDHSETQRSYFDRAGRLRFVLATRGAVNGTQQEERVYFAASGREVHRLLRRERGPGYPFAAVTPVRDPARWLRQVCD